MNDTALTQLKIIVERAVRPVRAPVRRKLKMREELLAHVIAVFDEEAVTTGLIDDAVKRTRQRFGEPAELTASLQATVPWVERMAANLHHHLCRRPDESAFHFALRHALLGGAYISGAGVVGVLSVLALLLLLPAAQHQPWAVLAWLSAMIPGFFLLTAIAVLLWHGMWHALFGSAQRSWLRVGLILLASSAVGPLVLFAISMQMTGELEQALREARPTIPLVALIPPFVFVFMADLIRRTTSGFLGRSWLYTIAMDTSLAMVLSMVIFGLSMIVTVDLENSLEHARVMACLVMTWLLPLDLVVSAPSVMARLRDDREWTNLPIDPDKGVMA